MPTRAFLFDALSTQKLYQINANNFIVLTQEDNGYVSALKITITNGLISLAELDLTYNQTILLNHSTTTENGIKTFILTPSKKDWTFILQHFVVYDSYVLKK